MCSTCYRLMMSLNKKEPAEIYHTVFKRMIVWFAHHRLVHGSGSPKQLTESW